MSEWLISEKVPGIYGIDTRLLTKKIRDSGAMLAKIEFSPSYMPPGYEEIAFDDPNSRNLVEEVSCTERIIYGEGNKHKILTIDCGIKNNIIRNLVERDVELHRVPWNYDFSQEMDKYDGLFLSNGPGNPDMAHHTVDHLKTLLAAGYDDPIFGICMGNQLLGMAAGAECYKLPFGNRGQNIPVVNKLTGECYITPQNHGYALDAEKLPAGWSALFENRNDGSNEGIMHDTKPFFTAQFHPEAMGGPTDTQFLFSKFTDLVASGSSSVGSVFGPMNPNVTKNVKKVLVLGSGGLSIGQAGEFDYSGNQAIKSLKEEGLNTVLMNPNIASVQTNLEGDYQADTVYFLPVTVDHVEEVIKKEKPDGLILSMGGQTALNIGVELHDLGILKKYNVEVLGTSVESIVATEDRGIFMEKLEEIGEKLAPSFAVTTIDDALEAARNPAIGFPCMIRSAFALGGLGSGICNDEEHLKEMAALAFAVSPQILVEKSMLGWKEVEYEVVRDAVDNCVTVCNMENFDPLGIHTGDSIVVAPSQTLSNHDYQMLRDTAIRVVSHLGIIGECNIQYALHPDTKEYCIIEVNPRLSRSSALASKATGYPLAGVAAKLALGVHLPDIRNSVTETTTACFEPSLDYIVCKIPRWDLTKFDRVSRSIGSAMKSIGEVMAIGRTFEESLQKALRMVDSGISGFEPHDHILPLSELENEEKLISYLQKPSDRRIYAIAYAMQVLGWSPERVHEHTKIDTWFLYKLERMVKLSALMESKKEAEGGINSTLMLQAKKSGFSDAQIGERIKMEEMDVRKLRKGMGITPFVKQIDTMAGEVPATTNYLYTTYNGDEHDLTFDEHGTMVLGSGCYRIGSSVEFDWCSVSAIRTLRKLGKKSVMVNYNPETVSTDYDECDRLYFEELSLERVLDIYELEGCESAIVSVGGQIPNNLALPLHETGEVNISGTSPLMIDNAEDRDKFSSTCDEWGIDQPRWEPLTSAEAAFDFADKIGYPVLVRPSYVLSGAAMGVAYSAAELSANLKEAGEINSKFPVVLSEFIENGREIDIDAVAHNGKIVCHAISEHVENAGVHSGDATLILPPHTIDAETQRMCQETAVKVAEAFQVTGPMNMQLIAKDGKVKLIEANIRASRSFPFSSKTVGADFIEVATSVMVQDKEPEWLANKDLKVGGQGPFPKKYHGVKAPMFSFKRLGGADPTLGVEMASTGEVACYGTDRDEALLKAYVATTQFEIPQNKRVLVSIQEGIRSDFKPALQKLEDLGYELFATEETHRFLQDNGIQSTHLNWAQDAQSPAVDTYLKEKMVDMVFMFSNESSRRTETNYEIRRLAVDFGIPLVTNLQVANALTHAIGRLQNKEFELESRTLREYYDMDGR